MGKHDAANRAYAELVERERKALLKELGISEERARRINAMDRLYRRVCMALLVLLALAVVFATRCDGAETIGVTWTMPTNAVTRSMEFVARRSDGSELALMPWADSARTTPFVPPGLGETAQAWLLRSTDPEAWVVWARPCNTAGCGDWSNRIVCIAGVVDTLWFGRRGPGALPLPSNQWQRSLWGRAGWRLAPGDSASLTPVHQEYIQRAERDKLMVIYGYWMLRGVKQQ